MPVFHFRLQALLEQRAWKEQCARLALLEAQRAQRELRSTLLKAQALEQNASLPLFLDLRERALLAAHALLENMREEEERLYAVWSGAREDHGRLSVLRERAQRLFCAEEHKREELALEECNRALHHVRRNSGAWMG